MMKKTDYIIIGSRAMKAHYPDFPRIPQDTDIIIKEEAFYDVVAPDPDIEYVRENPNGLSAIVKFKNVGAPYEYFFADKQRSLRSILELYCPEDDVYARPGVIYSLKKSHIHYPLKFEKHIKDYMFLRHKLRLKNKISYEQDLMSETDLVEGNMELTQMLIKDLEKRDGKIKTPKMNQTTEEFFGKSKNFVKSYYIHDNMHKAMALLHSVTASPVYEKFLKDGSEVETDIKKWQQLTLDDKLNSVLDEVYVIALERKILPMLFEKDAPIWTARKAFDWALMRVCTTLCDGFFREFATRAWDIINDNYNENYVGVFFENISKFENEETNEEN